MRKLLITVLTVCMGVISLAQSDTVTIVNFVDEMDGKTYYYNSREFVCASEDKQTGFFVNTHINDNGEFSLITIEMVNIGTCNESNELIILFENGEKITRTSFNKYNCKGKAYFSLTEEDKELLRTQELYKIRITNGVTYDAFTGTVKNKDKRYFIQFFYAFDNKLFVTKK